MQSNELIGIRDAALIPPSIPGAAYCNDGQHTTPFLCSAVRDVNRLVRNIGTAARFHSCKRPDLLFSEPLTQHATQSDLSIPSNQSWHNVPFALADDGVLEYTAILDVSQQNIAIIPICLRQRQIIYCCIAHAGYMTRVAPIFVSHAKPNMAW